MKIRKRIVFLHQFNGKKFYHCDSLGSVSLELSDAKTYLVYSEKEIQNQQATSRRIFEGAWKRSSRLREWEELEGASIEEFETSHEEVDLFGGRKVFLVRHGERDDLYDCISTLGKDQCIDLARKIQSLLNQGESVVWSSLAGRTLDSAEIVRKELNIMPEVEGYDILHLKSSVNKDASDFDRIVNNSKFTNIIAFTHNEIIEKYYSFYLDEEMKIGHAKGLYLYGQSIEIIGVFFSRQVFLVVLFAVRERFFYIPA